MKGGSSSKLRISDNDISNFVVEIKNIWTRVERRQTVGDLISFQQARINETLSALSICTHFQNLVIQMNATSAVLNISVACQLMDLGFSKIPIIYEIRTALPTATPSPPPLEVDSYVVVLILVPSAVCFLATAIFIYWYKRRKSALIFARRAHYVASASQDSRQHSKVRPGAFGHDIENFGIVEH
jgi:hypothetical protein